jgi:hypothetical protein
MHECRFYNRSHLQSLHALLCRAERAANDQGDLPKWYRSTHIGERPVRLKKIDVEALISPGRVTDREGEDIAIRRLTQDEQSQAPAAVEQARRLQAALLARRGGERFSPSWELLDEARTLRDRQQA